MGKPTINGPFSIATLNYQRVWGFSEFFKQSLVSKVIADCFVATNLVLIQASSYWLVGELPKDDMDDDDVEDLEENNVEESEEEEGVDGTAEQYFQKYGVMKPPPCPKQMPKWGGACGHQNLLDHRQDTKLRWSLQRQSRSLQMWGLQLLCHCHRHRRHLQVWPLCSGPRQCALRPRQSCHRRRHLQWKRAAAPAAGPQVKKDWIPETTQTMCCLFNVCSHNWFYHSKSI